ncbi:MAG: glycosyltransferase [Planctomycetes bacterium]|nr:glycosyltransferase [Planctomycetota bacterium]MCB9888007.1 glycosyltransferase [Planctomycetota bacterium]
MQVLHVAHGCSPENTGGIETYLRALLPAQRASGIEPALVTGSLELAGRPTVTRSEMDGCPMFQIQRDDWFFDHYAHSYHPGVSRLFRELVAQRRPDVVHLHQWVRLSSDMVAIARALDVPVVVTLHDVYTSCPRAFRLHRDGNPCTRPLSVANCAPCVPRFGHETEGEVEGAIELFAQQYRAELRMADRVLVPVGATADLLSATLGVPRERFTVLELCYPRRFAGRRGPPGEAAERELRFGYWGSLTRHKGPGVLIEAVRRIVAEPAGTVGPFTTLLFGAMSDEAFGAELRRAAEGLPVAFHGRFDHTDVQRAELDVGVFPSVCFETFGLALTECFELGLPAVVSDLGALPDRVGDAGLKVPAGDSAALADAMLRLLRDPALRQRLAAHIPPLPPTPEEHAAALAGVYRDASAGPHPPVEVVPAEARAQLLVRQRESLAAALRAAAGRRDPQ